MAKGIDTNSKEWCDLVFEGRNKKYGAYRMRITSSKRHIQAFVLTTCIITFLVSLPSLIERIEFYLFQHSDSNYVLEDYKFISDNLTEIQLLQLSKQFIPQPSKAKKKKSPSVNKSELVQNPDAGIPVIVDDSLLNNDIETYEKDTTLANNAEKPKEEVVDEDVDEETQTDDGLYTVLEQMPAFPGGEAGLMDFIYKNLRYPSAAAASQKNEHCVICTFIIDVKGNITEVVVTQPAQPLLDKEALRLVKSLPKWIPARQHGKPVRVKYTLPIVFRLK